MQTFQSFFKNSKFDYRFVSQPITYLKLSNHYFYAHTVHNH
jgi:hypothetical protein